MSHVPANNKAPRRFGLEPEDYYIDTNTGFMVFTEAYHRKRGYCCKSKCRHCPYGNRP
ncbi:MAG: DUF5522 domain-containing protein [Spirosomaceae bacterium]|nr:DUF5522 domain-containing protein [Spirosomataceae bacterium]